MSGAVSADVLDGVPAGDELRSDHQGSVALLGVGLGAHHGDPSGLDEAFQLGDPGGEADVPPFGCRSATEEPAEPSVPDAGLGTQLFEPVLREVGGVPRVRLAANVHDGGDAVRFAPGEERTEVIAPVTDREDDERARIGWIATHAKAR